MRQKSLAFGLSLLLFMPISAVADEVITLPPFNTAERSALFGPDPVQQGYILVTAGPSPPSICYLLSPGGGGGLFVTVNSGFLNVNQNNFLVRSRYLLAGAAQVDPGEDHDEGAETALQGSCVAVLDAATDFLFRIRSVDGQGLRGFRRSQERIGDIEAVIKDLRFRFGSQLRIVLVGTSRGTIDMAAYAAAAGATQVDVNADVDALVLTSTLTREFSPTNADHVFNVALDQVRVPTLLVFHKDDACFITPPEDVELVKAELVNAPIVKVHDVNGGFPPVDPNPCFATTFHGFLGKETKVIRKTVKFVNNVLDGVGDEDGDNDDGD